MWFISPSFLGRSQNSESVLQKYICHKGIRDNQLILDSHSTIRPVCNNFYQKLGVVLNALTVASIENL